MRRGAAGISDGPRYPGSALTERGPKADIARDHSSGILDNV